MEQEADRCAGLIRATMLAIDVISQKHRLDGFGFIVAVEKFPQAAGQKRYKLGDFIARYPTKALSQAKQLAPTRHRRSVDLGWRLEKKRLKITRQSFKLVIESDESVGVLRREFPKLGNRSFSFRPPGNYSTIRKGNLNCWIARHHP